jgi:hypothetical protein
MRSGTGKLMLMLLGMTISVLISVTVSYGQTSNYSYDDLNRLTRIDIESGGAGIDYTYDDVGNRVKEDTGREIRVTSPNGGETWHPMASYSITWTSSGISGNVKIEISRDGGASWQTLDPSTPNDGVLRWRVTRPFTALARIRVTSISLPFVADSSDGNFNIQ